MEDNIINNNQPNDIIKLRTNNPINTKFICRIALLAALMVVSRFAMSFYPNIELATTLLVVYTLVFGLSTGIFTSIIFVAIESMIYGTGWWSLVWIVYYPLLATCVGLLAIKKRKYNFVFAIIIGILCTCSFAVISAFFGAITGAYGNEYGVGKLFAINYVAGLPQAIIHIVSNIVILSIVVLPLSRLLYKINARLGIDTANIPLNMDDVDASIDKIEN